jgi:hypothetical protein
MNDKLLRAVQNAPPTIQVGRYGTINEIVGFKAATLPSGTLALTLNVETGKYKPSKVVKLYLSAAELESLRHEICEPTKRDDQQPAGDVASESET